MDTSKIVRSLGLGKVMLATLPPSSSAMSGHRREGEINKD
jgi:hypothetical protein